jgi:putative spermidine/putrescine transport system ATP-binding protein
VSEVRLSGVSKSFGSVRALDDVSLSVAEGELLTLLGPSGCGKTTLLRVVAGLEQPDTGTVHMAGEDITHRPTRERPIGMVFQSYALFPNLTVRQNVGFPLEVRHWPRERARARVDELLALTRLEPEADRFPGQISGGQAQRCALARALAPHPGVLLLDEPLSALDVQVRGHLRDEIRRIQQQVGTTTIYVTHDQAEALAIADRVAVMSSGRIVQVGPPTQVYEAPATRFAASFVGSRNSIELPVRDGRIALGRLFDVAAPRGVNGRVVCFVAPEDVSVAPDRGDAADSRAQRATIVGTTFHGATTRLQLALAIEPSVTLFADLPSRAAAGYRPGTAVTVRVEPGHVSAFAPSD